MTTTPAFSSVELGPFVVQLIVRDVDLAVKFYRGVFGADELYRNAEENDGRVVHCELLVNGTRLVLHEEFPEFGLIAPTPGVGAPFSLNLYLDDVDEVYARAVAAGAQAISSPQDRFWGARSGSFFDPSGHRWIVSTQVEDPSPEEIVARSKGVPAHDRLSAAPNPGRP